jgi:hypothetical protein
LLLLRAARRRRLAFHEAVQQASSRGSVVDGDDRLPRTDQREPDARSRFSEQS